MYYNAFVIDNAVNINIFAYCHFNIEGMHIKQHACFTHEQCSKKYIIMECEYTCTCTCILFTCIDTF